MNQIIKSLKKSEKGKRLALIVVYIINIAMLSIFMMLGTGLKDVYNARFDTSDGSQIIFMLFSVVGMSIICILILQWIVMTLTKSIFESREKFNVNLRLIGASKESLQYIYVKEMLLIQLITIPIGIFLAEIFWRCFFELKGEMSLGLWIKAPQIVFSVVIHIIFIVLFDVFVLKKLCSFNIIDLLRDHEKYVKIYKIKPINIIFFILGVITILLNYALLDDAKYILFIDLIGLFLALDFLILSFNYLILYLGKSFKNPCLIISQMNILGHYKKFKHIIIAIFLGISISVGLQLLINTIKEDMYLYSLYNIKYSDSLEYEDFIDEKSVTDILNKYNIKYSTGIYLLGKDVWDGRFYIKGIDSKHLLNSEQINIDKETSNINIHGKLDMDNYNGIMLPLTYVGKNDVGKIFSINYGGNKTYKFSISGGYCYNDADRWYTGIVSKSYLQNVIGQKDKINIIYLSKLSNNLEKELNNINGVKIKEHLTKLDIANNSRIKAINSSFILFIPAILIFLCAVIMIASIFVINKKQNNLDISKLRGFGLSNIDVISIYFFQILNIIFQSFVIGFIFSYKLCNTFILIVVGQQYMVSKTIWPLTLILILALLIISIATIIFLGSTKKGLSKDFVKILRED